MWTIFWSCHFIDRDLTCNKDTETEVRTGKLQLYVVKTIDTN